MRTSFRFRILKSFLVLWRFLELSIGSTPAPRCPQIEFLFKVADDIYVNVHKLAYYVQDFYPFGNIAKMVIYSQKVDESINKQNKPKPKRSMHA
jgi:hypothetical protein